MQQVNDTEVDAAEGEENVEVRYMFRERSRFVEDRVHYEVSEHDEDIY